MTTSQIPAHNPNRSPLPSFLSAADVAKMLNVGTMTIYRLCNDGAFQPPPIRVGRSIRIPLRAVRTFIGESAIQPGEFDSWVGDGS